MLKTFAGGFLVLFFIQFCSCTGNSNEAEIKMLDSLELKLGETEKMLKIDVSEIQKRLEKQQYDFNTIKMFYTDTFSRDFAFAMDDYKGIGKIYSKYLSNYQKLEAETSELKKQVSTLKIDLKKGKIPEADFQKYYATEKADVETNYKNAKEIAGRIIEIESMYQRVQTQVEPELKKAEEWAEKQQAK